MKKYNEITIANITKDQLAILINIQRVEHEGNVRLYERNVKINAINKLKSLGLIKQILCEDFAYPLQHKYVYKLSNKGRNLLRKVGRISYLYTKILKTHGINDIKTLFEGGDYSL